MKYSEICVQRELETEYPTDPEEAFAHGNKDALYERCACVSHKRVPVDGIIQP